MNTVVLIGRTTSDIELRVTQSGKSVARFSLAVNRKFDREKTDFIDILAWGKTAELLSKYVTKGQMIAIQGSIQTGSYEKDGIKRRTFEIVAENVSFCGGKSDNSSNDNGASETPSFSNADSGDFVSSVDDDELPF